MTQTIIRRMGSVLVLMLVALLLVSATDSSARTRHGASHRKSAHNARLAKGKRHAKLSHRGATTHASLSATERDQMVQKIKELAKSSLVSDDSVVAAEAGSLDIQAQLAAAAKEEEAEDDVDVSIEQFFQARPGSIDANVNPDVARARQQDFVLYDETDPQVAAQRSDIMAQIIDWIGTRYQFGGLSRTGIDCSAFTRAVFNKAFGFELPRTAVMQSQLGEPVKKDQLQFGDLVFFHTAGYAPITHVGIYIGEGLFANAACSKGVSVASLSSTYWSKHYVGAKRLFTNSGLATANRSFDGPSMTSNEATSEEGTLTNSN